MLTELVDFERSLTGGEIYLKSFKIFEKREGGRTCDELISPFSSVSGKNSAGSGGGGLWDSRILKIRKDRPSFEVPRSFLMSRRASCAFSPYWLTYRSKSREPGRPSSGKPSFLYSSWSRASIRIEMIIGFGRKNCAYGSIFLSHFSSSSCQEQELWGFWLLGSGWRAKSGRSWLGSGKTLKISSRFSGISEMRDSPKPYLCFIKALNRTKNRIRIYLISRLEKFRQIFSNKTLSWITWVFSKLWVSWNRISWRKSENFIISKFQKKNIKPWSVIKWHPGFLASGKSFWRLVERIDEFSADEIFFQWRHLCIKEFQFDLEKAWISVRR